ncbi:hypothetical protein VNO77_15980 [Canavalia gladiata]|uniref:Uncharacterized protein n=1 Tax=Canavalia gladiata TaxID=3824 RepID=A0AAN9M052_CANGL
MAIVASVLGFYLSWCSFANVDEILKNSLLMSIIMVLLLLSGLAGPKEKVLKSGIWKDNYGTDEKKVADWVREDQVDILVGLTGHTANNKLGMMACRPTPVQVF